MGDGWGLKFVSKGVIETCDTKMPKGVLMGHVTRNCLHLKLR